MSTLADDGRGENVTLTIPRASGDRQVPVWFVVVDGDLYVRSYQGVGAWWYRRALASGRGDAAFSGSAHPISFEHIDDAALLERISAEYLRKYAHYDYAGSIAIATAVEATLRVSETR